VTAGRKQSGRTLLVTGAGGFLGGYVAREFSQQGWRVVGVDRMPANAIDRFSGDVYHQHELAGARIGETLREEQPDACIHCAGSASVPQSFAKPLEDFHANVVLTAELLEAIRLARPGCRFVFLSSAAVYGSPGALPIEESTPIAPISPYGFHKLMAEHLCVEYAALHGVPTASARVFSAYGNGLRRQVLWDLSEKLSGDGGVVLQGTGAESRACVQASDIARALPGIVERADFRGEAYNVASGMEISISDLAEMILTAMNVRRGIRFDGVLPAGTPSRWRANIGRLESLGFSPEVPMERGVHDYAAWLKGVRGEG